MCLLVLMYLRDVSDLVLCMHAKSLQSCLTLCNLVDCRAYQAPLSVRFCRQEYWSGVPCPPPGDLPNPRIEPRSPTLQADSLQSEPPGKPMNAGVAYPFSRGSSRPRNWTRVSCIPGGFFTSWATRKVHSSPNHGSVRRVSNSVYRLHMLLVSSQQSC